MSGRLSGIIAQLAPDLEQVGESGISDVESNEWLLAAVIVVGTIVLSMLVGRIIQRVLQAHGPPAFCRLGGRLASLLVLLVGFFYAFRAIDVAVGPLLGALGIVGIALAFSMQEILANLVSGVLLQTRRPIRVGDQVVTADIEGVVRDINYRTVELTTYDGETVYVPNAMVLHEPITNWTKTPTRRTALEVGVAYDTDLGRAKEILIEALLGCEGVLSEPPPSALVYEFGESAINLSVRFWHEASIEQMWLTRDHAALATKRALDEHGMAIPFPQRTLSLASGMDPGH